MRPPVLKKCKLRVWYDHNEKDDCTTYHLVLPYNEHNPDFMNRARYIAKLLNEYGALYRIESRHITIQFFKGCGDTRTKIIWFLYQLNDSVNPYSDFVLDYTPDWKEVDEDFEITMNRIYRQNQPSITPDYSPEPY